MTPRAAAAPLPAPALPTRHPPLAPERLSPDLETGR